ncbi:MAG: LytTR family DNA-binding domain-containing protein, partial [Bacteroidota bacterium]|nr:LytTR family DNA-binding domain-containing protein [Bacteroidota bacterium]
MSLEIRKKGYIPDYFVTWRNTILQVLFTALFAFLFINIYKPFGAGEWYQEKWWMFSLGSAALVIVGMIVIIVSRLLMQARRRKGPIRIRYYVFSVAAEILFMGAAYAVLELVVLGGVRPFWILLYMAVQNTSLILLIPYIISLLFFSWRENKLTLEQLVSQLRAKRHFIPFEDENGVLRLTINSGDLLYLKASDNYVDIIYRSGEKTKTYVLRNTLKKLEGSLDGLPLLRCHRSYMVNVTSVKILKRDKGKFVLWLDEDGSITIP